MAKTFKNEKDLERFLLEKCKAAVIQAEQRVYSVIDSCLKNFYSWEPEEYKRTYQLLTHFVKGDVKKVGKGYEAEVYFDVGKMRYEQGLMELKHTPEHGMYGWATWDKEKVVDVAMTDGLPHGRYAGADKNEPIWSTSMNKLGDIWVLLEKELKKQGIPIKK